MELQVDFDGKVIGDINVGAVGTKDPCPLPPSPASTARAADRALFRALVAARGARSRKRVSEATSFEIRRFGLNNTSSRSRLALRRGHGPASFFPKRYGERAQELYLYHGSAVIGNPLRPPQAQLCPLRGVSGARGIWTTTSQVAGRARRRRRPASLRAEVEDQKAGQLRRPGKRRGKQNEA